MTRAQVHVRWLGLAFAALFTAGTLLCGNFCQDTNECHAADDCAVCLCLCHSPLAPLPEPLVVARFSAGEFLAVEPLISAALLPADIFRPPAC